MKETFYFSHDYNSRNDSKLVEVMMNHGVSGIGIFWCIVEMLYEEGGYLPLKYERITFELRTEKNVVQSIINDYGLFENDGEKFWSNSVIDRLKQRQEKSEKAKQSIQKRWDKVKNTNVLRTNNESNTIKERKGKENKINIVSKETEELAPIQKNTEIDNLIQELKTQADILGIAYDRKDERRFGKHIMTAKEFGTFCEKIGQGRIEFAKNIMIASGKIKFWKGTCSGPMLIYQNYAEVYNLTKTKSEASKIVKIETLDW